MTKLVLPNSDDLVKTGKVDYFIWNYKFPLKYIQRIRFRYILKLLSNTIYDNLLEIGTGSGIFLPELAKHCSNLYAVDVHDHLGNVEKLNEKYSLNAMICQSSITNTPYRDNFFDMIVGVSVLEFIDDLDSAIAELKRIGSPTGFIVVVIAERNFVFDYFLNLFASKKLDREFINLNKIIIRKLLKEFLVVRKVTFPPVIGVFFPVYRFFMLRKHY